MSARQGNYDPGEEEILVQKGRVLYSCYIDSLLPPKVQINITHDKVAGSFLLYFKVYDCYIEKP